MTSYLITKKTSFIRIAIFFIICFSFYWATNVMPISPIYFTTLLGFITFLFALKYKRIPNDSFLVYGACICYSLWFLFLCLICERNLHEAFVTMFFSLFYIFADIAMYQVDDKKSLKHFVKLYFYLFVAYYIVDFYLRCKTAKTAEVPGWIKSNPLFMFYMFKNGGLNGDSNTMGVFCCIVFAVMYYLKKLRIAPKAYAVFSFAMSILSFSRASMVSCIALILADKFFLSAKPFTKFTMILLAIAGSLFAFNLFLGDASFLTKLDIFEKTYKYALNCNMHEFLFGVGPNNSTQVLGLYAHNIWSITFIEYGFLQVIFFVVMMVLIFVDVGKQAIYVYATFFLVSLSYTTIFLQFLFVGLVLLKHTKRLCKDDRK